MTSSPQPPSISQLESTSLQLLQRCLDALQQEPSLTADSAPSAETSVVTTVQQQRHWQQTARLALQTLRYCQQVQKTKHTLADSPVSAVEPPTPAKKETSKPTQRSVLRAVPPSQAASSSSLMKASPSSPSTDAASSEMSRFWKETLRSEFRQKALHNDFPNNLSPPEVAAWVSEPERLFFRYLRFARLLQSLVINVQE